MFVFERCRGRILTKDEVRERIPGKSESSLDSTPITLGVFFDAGPVLSHGTLSPRYISRQRF